MYKDLNIDEGTYKELIKFVKLKIENPISISKEEYDNYKKYNLKCIEEISVKTKNADGTVKKEDRYYFIDEKGIEIYKLNNEIINKLNTNEGEKKCIKI